MAAHQAGCSYGFGDVLVGRAMESVMPHSMLVAPGRRDAIGGGARRHRGVELRLKRRDKRDAGHRPPERLDSVEVDRIVDGRGGEKLAEGFDQAVVYEESPAVLGSA